MGEILEINLIDKIASKFKKASYQWNVTHKSDAEIIDPGEGSKSCLAVTIDGLAEEISSGLYDDPYQIGWMICMINLSDLAAVGAEPLGLLVSMTLPYDINDEYISKLTKGISDACDKAGTFILGGDTNSGSELLLTGCAIGKVPKDSVISRIGAKPGDKIYATAPVGLGNIDAFLRLFASGNDAVELDYRPFARLKEAKILRSYASCCMDTSDGVIHTLDTLMRLNECKMVIYSDWERILHKAAFSILERQNIPFWLALAGIHGEFELCFTINPENEEKLLKGAGRLDWKPILLGEVQDGRSICIGDRVKAYEIDSALIRNIAELAGRDPEKYIKKLLEIGGQVNY